MATPAVDSPGAMPASPLVTTDVSSSGGSTLSAATSGLGKQDFLKLLMAEMSNQDPMHPMEDKDFLAQMAQFSALEAMQQLNSTMQHATNLQVMSEATAMVGKVVQAQLPDNSNVVGVVSSVSFTTGSDGAVAPSLDVDGQDVDLSYVLRVGNPSTNGGASS